MLLNNILDAVGKTPIIRLHKIGKELECELYVKCEFLNPGGSVKDRIAVAMIERAEQKGLIKPGDTLIEATSGNTGIGFALAGAVKGYHIVITMPEKMSREKEVILEALGATIYRTRTEAKHDDPDSHLMLARKLLKEIPNAHLLDQYNNPDNPYAHYTTTGEEIIQDMGKDVAMVVMGVGTGGTISGVAKKIKEVNPNAIIVGADPYGSILGGGTDVFPYLVEGIGYDFFPGVLDNSLVDEYIKVDDKNAFITAKQLIREEGLLVGGSSGSAVWAALQAAKKLKRGQQCVVVLPDSTRNYLTKFVDDGWMRENNL
jgi:cysteine synthase A